MNNCFAGVFLAAVLGTFTLCSAAKDKHLPLAPQVISAKTVYVDNQSGIAKLGDKAYEQFNKWGRLQVVQDRKQADLILLLSAREYNGGYITTGGGTTGSVDQSGNIRTTSNPTYTAPVSVNYTFVTLIDPKTGDSLWSDSKRWGNLYTGFHSATKGLIDELMKRINEQSPQTLGTREAKSSGSATKLSVASVPSGAEVEIDGNFVGNTPSRTELQQGDHTIVIKKRGFSAWQRKAKLSVGDVTINAELDESPHVSTNAAVDPKSRQNQPVSVTTSPAPDGPTAFVNASGSKIADAGHEILDKNYEVYVSVSSDPTGADLFVDSKGLVYRPSDNVI
jgi:hypothetical protein